MNAQIRHFQTGYVAPGEQFLREVHPPLGEVADKRASEHFGRDAVEITISEMTGYEIRKARRRAVPPRLRWLGSPPRGTRHDRIDPATDTDHDLVTALRGGNEQAFAELVDRYGPLMLRVARTHVASREAAEDVVQDTWLAVLDGIDRFEERSSLRTWIFRVLADIAKTKGVRDQRTIATSSFAETVDRRRFRSSDDEWPGHWLRPPQRWPDSPERDWCRLR